MLELVDVTKSYPSVGKTGDLLVLKGITLKVKSGQSVAIVGPSGSGKSTLLNVMGGLDYPTSGRVLLNGQDLSGLTEQELARIRNHEIGFVFQLHHLLPQCTVLENVLLPTLAGGKRDAENCEKRAFSMLERVGLKDLLQHRPGELSGGQRQRVAVVRALINNPGLLLADEPTGSLDSKTADEIAELLVEINRAENVSLVVVTHSMRIAKKMERILQLRDGKLSDGEKP
jgi:ABC-type lipoprotein export system ATPase subunit